MSKAYMPPVAQTVEWETPQYLFDMLNAQFGFTLDVAANADNAKTQRYFDKQVNGLEQSWDNEVVWCNPPYGREVSQWVQKASQAKAIVVMLLPARTDVRWFHDYVYGKAEIRFIRGRLKFGDSLYNAPFPNMIVIFKPLTEDKE